MGFKFGIIFTIVVILSVVFASVYLIVKYMEFMNNRSKEKLPVVIEKHYNNSNNYKKKKNREIIIDIESEYIQDQKFLLGDNKHVT